MNPSCLVRDLFPQWCTFVKLTAGWWSISGPKVSFVKISLEYGHPIDNQLDCVSDNTPWRIFVNVVSAVNALIAGSQLSLASSGCSQITNVRHIWMEKTDAVCFTTSAEHVIFFSVTGFDPGTQWNLSVDQSSSCCTG